MTSTVKYDWYQSDTTITITVLLKNAADKNYSVTIAPDSLRMVADGIEPIVLNLWDTINVENSSHKATPSKVEIKLAKLVGHRWAALEKQQELASAQSLPKTSAHDWDKITKEIEKQEELEKPQGDEAVQTLFQKIYADANENTKKAMMKSFYESNGTVLSTNWDDVGSKQVEVKPPDGCEFKQWK
ncbi:protein SGT1 homolog [Sabethes cyaneus]|uniref:protein SGT1 homolog n=1 Tax=Sabethes cyaneus TaxID=53552 RepID=UPI00237E9271|nr:protein SGT1 homolog [Sabethes cyaneus]